MSGQVIIGLIGCGNMGRELGKNLLKDEEISELIVYDQNPTAMKGLVNEGASAAKSIGELARRATIIVSMLPNDAILKKVVLGGEEGGEGGAGESEDRLLDHLGPTSLHISCSTVSPSTSRELAALHESEKGASFVGAPIFARPDGLASKSAYFVAGGDSKAIERARPLLKAMGGAQIHVFGENDAGAGNVVKLCGNFLIASSIEAISEALSLAESNGLDRVQVMSMLSSTIFDCLIYRGYGQRVSKRDHQPGGFSLALGCKDVGLVKQTAEESGLDGQEDMPLASLLHERFKKAMEKDGGSHQHLDWSAVATLSTPSTTTTTAVGGGNKKRGAASEEGEGDEEARKKKAAV